MLCRIAIAPSLTGANFALVLLGFILLLFSAGAKPQDAAASWDVRSGHTVYCGSVANPVSPACAITSGPGCNAGVPGQCSFPKADARAACMAHSACRAITCDKARTDCQARSAAELGNLKPHPRYDSMALITQVPPPVLAQAWQGEVMSMCEGNRAVGEVFLIGKDGKKHHLDFRLPPAGMDKREVIKSLSGCQVAEHQCANKKDLESIPLGDSIKNVQQCKAIK